MVFSSVNPAYIDHLNWQQVQQPNHHQQSSLNDNSQLQPPPPAPPSQEAGGGSSSSVRPGSMVDRARQAKVPQPEAGLNCPRCDSTNTKFCYFNNYSLTQPRHFCKACRRYWTRGGSLRNVPVGGGYRKNKRTKNNSSSASSSKSQVSTQGPNSKSTSVSPSPSSCSPFPQPAPQFPFMSTLQNLAHYGGFQTQMAAIGGGGEVDLGFQVGNNCNNSGGSSNMLLGGGVEQWRLPFLGGLDQPPRNSYLYQTHQVKMEENQGLNLSRQFTGVSDNNQYWSGNQWTELSGVNPSATSNLL